MKEAGLTIIELMISMLLAAILTAGLFMMVSAQTQTYTTQTATMTTQENLWGAMEYLLRQVRLAGYGFGVNCPGGVVRRFDGSNCGTTVESTIVALRVYNDCNLLTTAPTSCPDGSNVDSFSVAYEQTNNSGGTTLRRQVLTSNAGSIFVSAPGNISSGDLLVISQPGTTQCTLLKATGAPVETLQHDFQVNFAADGDINPPGCNIFPAGGYAKRARVAVFNTGATVGEYQVATRHFAIDSSKDPPRLVTWTTLGVPSANAGNLETVADGIEDMQISFACDDNGDGTPEEGNTVDKQRVDEWSQNVPGEISLPTCNPAPISVVRVTLIGRTASADPLLKSGYRPGAEDRPAGTSAEDEVLSKNMGTFPRRQLTTTVRPHNITGGNP